jgi:hypothetical protein
MNFTIGAMLCLIVYVPVHACAHASAKACMRTLVHWYSRAQCTRTCTQSRIGTRGTPCECDHAPAPSHSHSHSHSRFNFRFNLRSCLHASHTHTHVRSRTTPILAPLAYRLSE